MSRQSEWIDAFAGVKLVVFGDVMLDRYTFGDCNRISPEAPAPVFLAQRVEEMVGGAGNVARNIASLGGKASLIGAIGHDSAGFALIAAADDTPGLTPHLTRTDAARTAVKNRFVAKNQQMLRVDEEDIVDLPEATIEALFDHLDRELEGAAALVLSDYGKGVLSRSTIARAAAMARSRGLPVIIDPKSRDLARYRGATVITPNAKEAEAATGLDCHSDAGAAEAAELIADQTDCPVVVITRGPQGMTVRSIDGAIHHMPTAAREVFDVSGAGDTVVAALALALACHAPIEAAAELANRAAGIVVGKVGTATVSAAELHRTLHDSGTGSNKIADLTSAAKATHTWQASGQRCVFTNGCFDLLHPGHISLLAFAKAQGDKLIVAINSDASVKRLKGPDRPVQNEHARAVVMAALRDVDLVVVFDEDTPLEAITAIGPDVLVKGADYSVDKVVGGDVVTGRGGRVVLAPLLDGHSTTAAIDRAGRNA
ncbi:D-glycero-beta-D-manno-heptose-7-phosphate kinase [uncultured Maricaulis sp.]|uniref:D-glycero-beta-D-manno-heptose-7-phosphate kinase n=1 Tax=uncultured Maricaulis sp. TaxID=174710 RepID=UPI0030D93F7A|tara:strand:- start:95209 stop:96663 length:1455 start_codon:yes stop_codon:yes gene_type:complete